MIPNLPCLSHPTAILPGSQYQIKISGLTGTQLLDQFNDRNKYNSSIFKPLNDFFPLDKSNSSSPPNYFIAILPQGSTDIGCVCRIINFKKEKNDTDTTLFVKTLQRVIIKKPLLNAGNKIWQSHVELYQDSKFVKEVPDKEVKLTFLQISKVIESLETTINEFNSRYKNVFKKTTSEHFLLLSPLSNTLFFQLNNEQFKKNWSKVKQICKDQTNEFVGIKNIDKTNIDNFFSLLDIFISIIPTSNNEKLQFLICLQFQERILKFIDIVNTFLDIFEQLYSTTNYIKRFYADATVLEKTNFIAAQLKSLKFYVNDVKGIKTKASNKYVDNRILRLGNREDDVDDNADDDGDDIREVRKFMKNIKESGIHGDGQKLLIKDFKRLKKMQSYQHNAEYQVLRNYFDIIVDVPFGNYSGNSEVINLSQSKTILNNDHFGLISVKKRLLEYLAVLKLNQSLDSKKENNTNIGRPPILLLVGPPGVGKTSIAKSIAKVLHRKYQRISLGGVYNEADLRGHRRTYVGAMCGSIINALRKSGKMNPLILLDEIDKISSIDGKKMGKSNGDPEGALLEILDFEQNFSFLDHYIGFPVDISQVLFICTANNLNSISKPLLDRLEIIDIPGYTIEEKIQIGSKFLLPKQIAVNGLNKCYGDFHLSENVWRSLVSGYTRETGVRNLERKLASIVRGKIVEYINNETLKVKDQEKEMREEKQLYKYLGFPLHPITKELLSETQFEDKIGLVNGLSYNSDGSGSVLTFEILRIGSNNNNNNNGSLGPIIKSTGNLGETLQESIEIGTSLVKSIIDKKIIKDIDEAIIDRFLTSEYHLHAPMGGVPKDGPSAGMAITLALLSLAINKPINRKICMTGEITLRGKILPIGGLKEKLLGATMYGMQHVLVPIGNRNDVVTTVTDDIVPYIENIDSDATTLKIDKLVRNKMDLEISYVNDIYDAMHAIWPGVEFSNSDDAFINGNDNLESKL